MVLELHVLIGVTIARQSGAAAGVVEALVGTRACPRQGEQGGRPLLQLFAVSELVSDPDYGYRLGSVWSAGKPTESEKQRKGDADCGKCRDQQTPTHGMPR